MSGNPPDEGWGGQPPPPPAYPPPPPPGSPYPSGGYPGAGYPGGGYPGGDYPGAGYPGAGYPGGGYPGGGYAGGGYPGGGYPAGGVDPSQQAPGGQYLAGWWRRVGASIVDSLVLLVPTGLLSYGLGRVGGGLIVLVIQGLYFTLLIARRGGTLGNSAVSTRVVDATTGAPLTTGRAFGRWAAQLLFNVGAILFLIPTLLDILWPLWDSRNQTLHDKMAGTLVVFAP